MIKKNIIILFALFLNISVIAQFLKISGGVMILFATISIIATILIIKKNGKIRLTKIRINYVFIFLIILISQSIISLLWSRAPMYGFNKILFFTIKLILTIPLALIVSRNPNFFFKYFQIFTIPIILFVLIQYGNPITLLQNFGIHDRLGMDEGPIAVGRYFGMISIMYFILLKEGKTSILRIYYLFLFIITLTYTVLSGSKGPMFSVFFTIIFYVFTKMENTAILKNIFKISVLLLLFGGYNYMFSKFEYGDFVKERFINNTRSYDSRRGLYEQALKEYSESNIFQFFFGHGAGDFGMVEHHKDLSGYPHNLLLEVIYENGLFGIIILLMILYLIFKKAYRCNDDVLTNSLIFISVFYVSNSMFSGDYNYNSSFILYYFIYFYISLNPKQDTSVWHLTVTKSNLKFSK